VKLFSCVVGGLCNGSSELSRTCHAIFMKTGQRWPNGGQASAHKGRNERHWKCFSLHFTYWGVVRRDGIWRGFGFGACTLEFVEDTIA